MSRVMRVTMMVKRVVTALILTSAILLPLCLSEHFFDLNYENKSLHLFNITQNTRLNCKKSIRTSNNNKFITQELRHNICQLSYASVGQQFKTQFNIECFRDESHLGSRINPCFILCMEKHEKNYENRTDCDNFVKYSDTEYLLIDYPCGPHHICDNTGCCVEISVITGSTQSKTQSTHPITTQSSTDTTYPITNRSNTQETQPVTSPSKTHSTQPVTTQSSIETTQIPITFKCTKAGRFQDPQDKTKFYQCQYQAKIERCDKDQIFSHKLRECVFDKRIIDPKLGFDRWYRAIKCTKSGTFKSLYNCHYFYSCIPTVSGYVVYVDICFGTQVFNETIQQCDYKRHRCNNRLTVP